jgi:hypothetical protein
MVLEASCSDATRLLRIWKSRVQGLSSFSNPLLIAVDSYLEILNAI